MNSADAIQFFLGIGSNIAPRETHLKRALDMLVDSGSVRVIRASSVYESEPWGKHDQDAFLNAVLECETLLEAPALLSMLKDIENKMGRVQRERFGPRIIDLDILLYGNMVIEDGSLQIPHPRMHLRRFVLVPLAEIAPNLRHPSIGVPILDLIATCPDMGRIWKYGFALM